VETKAGKVRKIETERRREEAEEGERNKNLKKRLRNWYLKDSTSGFISLEKR